MDFHRQYGVDIRIARIFNTYGPRMCLDDGRVVSNFIVQGIQKQCLSLYGDGGQTRSFCFVEDLVDGLISLMNTAITIPINLGNSNECTVKELATEITSILGDNEPQFEYRKLPVDDPGRRRPDISKAKKLLGWEPRVSLREGLERTIEDFRSRLCHVPAVKVPHQGDALTLSEDLKSYS